MILVCPPFQLPELASLCVAHLATYVRSNGMACAEAYPHFDLARIVGLDRYAELAGGWNQAGELLFAEGLHGEPSAPYAQSQLALFGDAQRRATIRARFLEEALPPILEQGRDLVGFTTSFHQLMCSLWLAKEVKLHLPATTIVLGGASCREPMGTQILKAYPQIDYVVSGFGEVPLLALARGERPASRLIRNDEYVDLDSMPTPDYTEYLRCANRFGQNDKLALAFESSRGCWWGQKNHCKFCGLNGTAMRYSAKSTARTIEEIRELWSRYGQHLLAVDAIMPYSNMDEILVALAQFEDGPKIFYEIKATLTESQVAAMARARIQAQPGLESLSTHLLGLMGKGGSTIRTLAFLKWCRERGLAISWNQLYGVPGERLEDYDAQLALTEQIIHFPPPERACPVVLTRFSPYFENFADYGWASLSPRPDYESMHPQLSPQDRHQIAAFFRGVGGPDTSAYAERFTASVANWQKRNEQGDGLFLDATAGLVRNADGAGNRYRMTPLLQRVLDCTHVVTSLDRVREAAGCEFSFLDQMQKLGLLYIEGNKALNLAVRTGLN